MLWIPALCATPLVSYRFQSCVIISDTTSGTLAPSRWLVRSWCVFHISVVILYFHKLSCSCLCVDLFDLGAEWYVHKILLSYQNKYFVFQASLLKSYEGLVGCKYSEHGYFVTSPNMTTMPHLPFGNQNIRLRQQLHYGEHDPCLVPQPFNINARHLSLIHFPGGDTDTTIFWTYPSALEFEPIDGQRLSDTPLGRIPLSYTDTLNQLFHQLTISSASSTYASEVSNDSSLKDYRRWYRSLVAQLQHPATLTEALATWCLAQVNFLELEARILWLTSVKPIYMVENSWETHSLRNVVGAVTDRLNTAESLFRVSFSAYCFRQWMNFSSGWNSCLACSPTGRIQCQYPGA